MFAMMVETLVEAHDVTPEYVKALVRDEKQREAGQATDVEATPGDLLGEEWAAFLTELGRLRRPRTSAPAMSAWCTTTQRPTYVAAG